MNKIIKLLFVIFFWVFPVLHLFGQDIQTVEWICSTQDHPWVKKDIPLKMEHPSASIQINPDNTLQTIDGFGGCFNELGWKALNSVSYAEKREILNNLFNQVSGCKFNICRMPMGANDYAADWYSLNETPGDFAMSRFSIARDRLYLIPYIKAAKELKPDLQVWASPWSPPSWMKTNKAYSCRSPEETEKIAKLFAQKETMSEKEWSEKISPFMVKTLADKNQFIMDDKTLTAYGLYFSKFIQAYKKEGINIYAVHVQNEPNSCQDFPSCTWTPEGLNQLVKYVGRQFEKDGLKTEIWLGTIERPQPEGVDAVLGDPEAAKYLTGVGFQWAGKGVLGHVNEIYSDLKLMQTETECGDGSNDWAAMEHTFSLIRHYFMNGANAYLYWNMVLDHTGTSHWGWNQNAMVTITEDLQVRYNPEFYLMKHFSYFIKPSARFLSVTNDENCLAFLNPDNEVIVIYYNQKDEPVTRSFKIGSESIRVKLQEKSLNTFVVKK